MKKLSGFNFNFFYAVQANKTCSTPTNYRGNRKQSLDGFKTHETRNDYTTVQTAQRNLFNMQKTAPT